MASREDGFITYSELAEQITVMQVEARDPKLFKLLEEISTAEDEAGRGMLSAIVVHKTGGMRPGQGFFDLAKELGRDTSNDDACWLTEVATVRDYWTNKANQP